MNINLFIKPKLIIISIIIACIMCIYVIFIYPMIKSKNKAYELESSLINNFQTIESLQPLNSDTLNIKLMLCNKFYTSKYECADSIFQYIESNYHNISRVQSINFFFLPKKYYYSPQKSRYFYKGFSYIRLKKITFMQKVKMLYDSKYNPYTKSDKWKLISY